MTLAVFGYVGPLVILAMFGCRPFGDLSRVWLCYVGPLLLCRPLVVRPFGDLSRVWLCYVGPLVTLAVFGYVV